MTATLDNGTITALTVDASGETAGFGQKCGEEDFTAQFIGKTLPVTLGEDVDAVAGCLPGWEPPQLEGLVHFGPGALAQALAAVDGQAPGTWELSPCDTLEETLALAREKGAREVLMLEDGTERREAL